MNFSAISSNQAAGPANSISVTSTLTALPSGSAILLVVKGKLTGGKSSTLQLDITANSSYTVSPSAAGVNLASAPIYQAGAAAGMGNAVFMYFGFMLAKPSGGNWAANFPAGVILTAATHDGSNVSDWSIALYAIASDNGAVSSPPNSPTGQPGVGSWYHNSSDSAVTSMQVAMNGSTVSTGAALIAVAHLNTGITLTDPAGFSTRLDNTGLVIAEDYFVSPFAQGTQTGTLSSGDVYVVAAQTLVDGGSGRPTGPTGPVGPNGGVDGTTNSICSSLGLGASPYLGTGADGDLHFDGVSAVTGCSLSAGVYTVNRRLNATHIAIDLNVKVKWANHIICCSGTVDGPGTLDNSGADGQDGTNNAGGNFGGVSGQDSTAAAGDVKPLVSNTGSGRGGKGGAGAVNGGGSGSPGANEVGGGAAGQGGLSGGFPGGAGGTSATSVPAFLVPVNIPQLVSDAYNAPSNLDLFSISSPASGGAGGGGGSSSSALGGHNNGGGGGGRGGYGGWGILFCKSANINLQIDLHGGKGGRGADGMNATGIGGNAGGGGGAGGGNSGGGGIALIVTEDHSSCSLVPNVSAGAVGAFGAGGSPYGSGTNHAGDNGAVGLGANNGVAFLVSTGISSPSTALITFSLGSMAGTVTDNKAMILLPAFNAGDRRAQKRFGDIFAEAQVAATTPIKVDLWTAQYSSALGSYSPTSFTYANGGLRAPYLIDFASGNGQYATDLEAELSWELGANTSLITWQPTVVPQPEGIQNRPSDWMDAGVAGNKFVQGLMLEFDSFGSSKTFSVQRSDDLALFTPIECPTSASDQRTRSFTFAPPFLAHDLRIVSTDSVAWRIYSYQFLFQPFPEQSTDWHTEFVSFGRNWQSIPFLDVTHISTADLILTLQFDQGPVASISVPVPNSGGVQTTSKVTVGANKFRLVSFHVTSAQPCTVFRDLLTVWTKEWGSTGPFTPQRPFGGPSSEGAEV